MSTFFVFVTLKLELEVSKWDVKKECRIESGRKKRS